MRVARVLELARDVEGDDVVALLRQRERGGAALAVRGARDERDPAHAGRALRGTSRGSRRAATPSASLTTFVAIMIAAKLVSGTSCSSSNSAASGSHRSSPTPCGSIASWRPNAIARSSSSSVASASGSSPAVDQDPPEERRADQAVVLRRDRVAEQCRAPLAQERDDLVVERVPRPAAPSAPSASAPASTSCWSSARRWRRARRPWRALPSGASASVSGLMRGIRNAGSAACRGPGGAVSPRRPSPSPSRPRAWRRSGGRSPRGRSPRGSERRGRPRTTSGRSRR